MAPKFSGKWKNFHKSGGSFDVDSSAKDIFETINEGGDGNTVNSAEGGTEIKDELDLLEDQAISQLSTGLMSYFSHLVTASDQLYNKTAQTFYFQIDERLVCCLIYFVGPFDTTMLKQISALLKIFLFKPKFDLSAFIENLISSIWNTVINMLNSYLHQLVSQVIDKIYKMISKIGGDDLFLALKYCIGLELILKIIDEITSMLLEFVDNVLSWLEDLVGDHLSSSQRFMEITVENKVCLVLAAMLEALANKIDDVQDLCDISEEGIETASNPDPVYGSSSASPPEGASEEFTLDEQMAIKAINFISKELPTMYPVLNLSEDVRRKHFRNVAPFKTETLGVPVSGFGSAGTVEFEDLVYDCAKNSPAKKLIVLADKIADRLKTEEPFDKTKG